MASTTPAEFTTNNTPTGMSKSDGIVDLESKFRQHLIIPVLDDTSAYSKTLVPQDYLYDHSISIDKFLSLFKTKKRWSQGDYIIGDLAVQVVINNLVICSPMKSEKRSGSEYLVNLDESGSSANVTLVAGADGKLIVSKLATGNGIDGNGAPWLRRQSAFLNESRAVQKPNLFVQPIQVDDRGTHVHISFPYIPSHSLGELAFANVGVKPFVSVIIDMLAKMSTTVWCESQEDAEASFIQKAHFDRMRRRVKIARAQNEELDKILSQKMVTLNNEQLLGFEAVMEKLETHPTLARVGPKILTEIHGDLNISNILYRLDSEVDEVIALIDPRGVPLLGGDSNVMLERGDYCYDISKLLFSLTGFSEIRKGFFKYSVNGTSHSLTIQKHPGSETINSAACQLIPKIKADTVMRQWIEKVEQHGAQSFELRVRIGEAAHFVADCACALGRDTPWEIVPLFLLGLQKLNALVDLLDTDNQLQTDDSDSKLISPETTKDADLGVAMIQQKLYQTLSTNVEWPYNVLEVSINSESFIQAKELLLSMVGTYLPVGTCIHLSTDPIERLHHAPPCWVLIHPSNGASGQTHVLAAATRRTTAFFKDVGYSQNVIDSLNIVHISPTGSSSGSQLLARHNDKLLSPGSFGISPLQLTLMQAVQLPFPKSGRWLVENDSFFLLSNSLAMSGNNICLLAIERPVSNSEPPWRIHVDDCEERDGILFAKSFGNIALHQSERFLLRATTGIFLPHQFCKAISFKEDDYSTRTSPLMVDVVLPYFMDYDEWVKLCHQQGHGVNSHVTWQNAKSFSRVSDVVELAYGSDRTAFYHFGSDSEYGKLLGGVRGDARLNSLSYMRAAIQFRQNMESKSA